MAHQKTDPRPHLVPATYAWIAENFSRVYLTAVVSHPDILLPPGIATQKTRCIVEKIDSDGKEVNKVINVEVVILNFGAEAIGHYRQDEHGMYAKMRFNGKVAEVYVPFASIIGVHSPDDSSNRSIAQFPLYFGQENLACDAAQSADTPHEEKAPRRARPVLTVVK